MTSHIRKLIESRSTTVTVPEKGWQFKLVRANAYEFIGRGVPLGSLLQSLGSATATILKGEVISDEDAVALNRDAPSYAEMCERLIIVSVRAMKVTEEEWREEHPDAAEQPWERLRVLANDAPESELGDDGIRVDEFIRALPKRDLDELQGELWNLNGLGAGVAALLAPFRERPGGAPGHDGEPVRDAANGGAQEV